MNVTIMINEHRDFVLVYDKYKLHESKIIRLRVGVRACGIRVGLGF